MTGRTAAFVFAFLFAFTSFTACAADAGQPSETSDTKVEASPAETGAGTNAVEYVMSLVPGEDMDGYEFRFLNFTDCTWAITNMDTEENSGEPINDAVFKRNAYIEDKLNIKMTEHTEPGGSVYNKMLSLIKAGDGAYDVFWGYTQNCAGLMNHGMLYDLNKVSAINREAEWYNQSLNRKINIGNKTLMLFGDAHMGFYQAMYVWGFSKKMAENLNLDDPYDLMAGNRWTWEAMLAMSGAASADLNGDGGYDIDSDRYGLGISNDMGVSFLHASGYTLTEKDENDYPVYKGLAESFYQAYSMAVECLYTRFDHTAVGYLTCPTNDNFDKAFKEGRLLFVMDAIGAFMDFRDGEEEYGVVSVPKYSETQEGYITPMYYNSMAMMMPVTNAGPERTGVIIENLSALSYVTVRPAFIGNVVHYKYARDEMSAEIISECIDSASVDIAYVYNWGSAQSAVQTQMSGGKTDLSSAFAKIEPKVIADIEKTVAAFKG